MRSLKSLLAVAIAAIVLGGGASIVAAAETQSVAAIPPGGDVSSMAKFYTGSVGQTGAFPGKLMCLRCDLAHSSAAPAQCAKEGHRHALSMDDGSMVHPLLAGSPEVLEEINSNELHAKDVVVHGKYYPSTGAILVDSVRPSQQ